MTANSYMNQDTRINNLDALKLICAFLVVCIHAPFTWDKGLVTSITRVAVPIFFMITGYFYQLTTLRGYADRQIKRIIKLIVYSNLFYFVWKLLFAYLGNKIICYLKGIINLDSLKNLLLFNESPFEMHLWYLNALLYVLIVVRILFKHQMMEKIIWIVPFLLLGDLLMGKYSLLLFHREFNLLYVRNFLFVGFPYFMIGYLIYNKKEHISFLIYGKRSVWLYYAVPLFVLTTVLERTILERMGCNASRDHYISTTLLAVTIFISALYLPDLDQDNLLVQFGKRYSTLIFILHLAVKDVFAIVAGKIHLSWYLNVRPVVVFIGSLVFSVVFYFILDNSKEYFRNSERNNAPNQSTRYVNREFDKNTRDLPELYITKENCCGCSACYATCSVGAIVMEFDEEGFLYPTVDASLCVRCYRCIPVCAFKKDQANKGYLKEEQL